jgi:hypothetical protein
MQKEKRKEQEEQDIKDVIATRSSDLDKEDKDPRMEWGALVIDHLWLQRIKHKPVRDCYYTAKKAKARDPFLVDNPTKTTIDSKNNTWDKGNLSKDKDFDPNVEIKDIETV